MATQHPLKRSRSPSPTTSSSPVLQRFKTSESVKFLVISDTHDAELSFYPHCDVLLHCGDLTEDGTPSSISNALKALRKVNAELKLVIPGNHEISLDKDYYLAEGGTEDDHLKARDTAYGPEARRAGVSVLDEGTHTFTLKSGATFSIYASPWTPKYGASAFQYPSNKDRFNEFSPKWAENVGTETSVIPEGVDIVMTHGPPKYILDSTSDGRSAGCEHLRRAIARTRPKLHCFGHVHRGYGAQRIEFDPKWEEEEKSGDDLDCIVALPKEWVGKNQAKRKGYASLPPNSAEAFRDRKQTLMVNAAVMDEKDEPGNAPWVVNLELPLTKGAEGLRDGVSSVR
ncbi:Metallo-dependent phosphatase [Trematosphaeria pertusa]|uniref:Metallo-dependent phosphatase n=1 Tax=Trematosphaeria pertusa TaxID=390896 RepID=A0A6A6IZN7_9PLEO|nr:Metallo-dependent phosphatase [Trematosphaeria pertusa]KAF2255050.1 Metallo-dependent phosphatase [Trematosphaeria pertusa]